MDMDTIRLEDYDLSGGGKFGDSYAHKNNPDLLLKLYPPHMEQLVQEEFDRACKVFHLGIPCPKPGKLVRTDNGSQGILFERIVGKKSYSRAVSEHPDRLEQYASEFAGLCKRLHAVIPEPGLFPTVKEQSIKEIVLNPFLSEEEKAGLIPFIKQLPDADTALHGDLHYGNVIFTEDGKQYFIDLGDFCTGDPLFDLGCVMLHTCMLPEILIKDFYHMDLATSKAFWRAFVAAYFGADASLKEIEERVLPYAVLRVLFFERMAGAPLQQIRPIIHAMIGNNQP